MACHRNSINFLKNFHKNNPVYKPYLLTNSLSGPDFKFAALQNFYVDEHIPVYKTQKQH